MLFPTLGPSSLPVVVAQPDERHAHSTTSGSNEEAYRNYFFKFLYFSITNFFKIMRLS